MAVERVPDCLLLAMEKVMARGLNNVVFVCDDAARLEEMFAPGEVDRIYLNFCDPWPSKKHAKRRLTYETFLLSYRKFLKEGGSIEFKTDNRPLFDFSLTQFNRTGYRLSEVTHDLHRERDDVIQTDYEARFVAEGVKINRWPWPPKSLRSLSRWENPLSCPCWTTCPRKWTISPTAWRRSLHRIKFG